MLNVWVNEYIFFNEKIPTMGLTSIPVSPESTAGAGVGVESKHSE